MDDGTVAGRKAVMGALSLYLDFINLFLFMLRFRRSPLSQRNFRNTSAPGLARGVFFFVRSIFWQFRRQL